MCINHRKELNHLPSMSITARESNSAIVICRSFWNHSSVNTNPSNCASFLWDRKSHRQIDTSEDVKKTISTEENHHAAEEWMRRYPCEKWWWSSVSQMWRAVNFIASLTSAGKLSHCLALEMRILIFLSIYWEFQIPSLWWLFTS